MKADRADMRPLAGKCSENAWPYFEASCLRDTRNPFGKAREVRIVSPDRLTQAGRTRRPLKVAGRPSPVPTHVSSAAKVR